MESFSVSLSPVSVFFLVVRGPLLLSHCGGGTVCWGKGFGATLGILKITEERQSVNETLLLCSIAQRKLDIFYSPSWRFSHPRSDDECSHGGPLPWMKLQGEQKASFRRAIT